MEGPSPALWAAVRSIVYPHRDLTGTAMGAVVCDLDGCRIRVDEEEAATDCGGGAVAPRVVVHFAHTTPFHQLNVFGNWAAFFRSVAQPFWLPGNVGRVDAEDPSAQAAAAALLQRARAGPSADGDGEHTALRIEIGDERLLPPATGAGADDDGNHHHGGSGDERGRCREAVVSTVAQLRVLALMPVFCGAAAAAGVAAEGAMPAPPQPSEKSGQTPPRGAAEEAGPAPPALPAVLDIGPRSSTGPADRIVLYQSSPCGALVAAVRLCLATEESAVLGREYLQAMAEERRRGGSAAVGFFFAGAESGAAGTPPEAMPPSVAAAVAAYAARAEGSASAATTTTTTTVVVPPLWFTVHLSQENFASLASAYRALSGIVDIRACLLSHVHATRAAVRRMLREQAARRLEVLGLAPGMRGHARYVEALDMDDER